MKKTIFALAMALVFSVTAFGQTADNTERASENRAEKMTEKMVENLSLSEDQKAEVYKANLKYVTTSSKKRKEHVGQYKADLKEILTEEQYEKWEAMKTERKAAHKKERHKE